MAEALILDSEALNALANAGSRGVLWTRARAILTVAYERRAQIRVPAPVLAELYRGPRLDPAIDRVLQDRGIVVHDLDRAAAKRAGHLLATAKLSSASAVDAFVVATALAFSSAVIATGDPDDLSRLAAPYRNVTIFAL